MNRVGDDFFAGAALAKKAIHHIRFDAHDAAAFDGFGAVSHHIFERLPQQPLVEPDLRTRRHQLHFNLHIGNFEILKQLANELVDVAAAQVGLGKSGELQVFADNVVQPVQFLEHRADQASRFFVRSA